MGMKNENMAKIGEFVFFCSRGKIELKEFGGKIVDR